MRYFFLTFTIVLLAIAGCSVPGAVVTKRQAPVFPLSSEVNVALTDKMGFNERTGIYYRFEYDNENLFIQMATRDTDLQRKIATHGFTVWIDRTGEKKKVQGFRFPLGIRVANNTGERNRSAPRMGYRDGSQSTMFQRANEIELIGIYGTSVRTVKLRDSRIEVKAELADDLLFYEAVVPYEVLKYGYNPLAGKGVMSIGFETGLPESVATQVRQMPSDGRRPGEGIRPGGDMSGQAQGGMYDRRPVHQAPANTGESIRPTRLWLELKFDN